MKDVITRFIKSLGVAVVLRNKHFEDAIRFDIIDFLGVDDKYYSFMVAYNDTRFFVGSTSLLGDGNSADLFTKLTANLRSFESKDLYATGRYEEAAVQAFKQQFKRDFNLFADDLVGHTVGGFLVTGVEVWVNPIACMNLKYSYGGDPQESITLVLGSKMLLRNGYCFSIAPAFKEFWESLGLEDYYVWEEKDESLQYIEIWGE